MVPRHPVGATRTAVRSQDLFRFLLVLPVLLAWMMICGVNASAQGGQTLPVPNGDLQITADRSAGNTQSKFTFRAAGRVLSNRGVSVQWSFPRGVRAAGNQVSTVFPEAGLIVVTAVASRDGQALAVAELPVAVAAIGVSAPPGIPFATSLADVNEDRRVDIADLLRAGQAQSGLRPLSPAGTRNADLDHDGRISRRDVDLLAQALAEDAQLPGALLKNAGTRWSTVPVISPHLLDLGKSAEVVIEGVRIPLERTVAGYGLFTIPQTIDTKPRQLRVELQVAGRVVQSFAFEILPLPEVAADPRTDLKQLLDEISEVQQMRLTALRQHLQLGSLGPLDREIIESALLSGQLTFERKLPELRRLIDAPGGEAMAGMMMAWSYANGLEGFRGQLAQSRKSRSKLTPDQVCDVFLPGYCGFRSGVSALQTAGDATMLVCGGLGIAAAYGSLGTLGGSLAVWGEACGQLLVVSTVATTVLDLVASVGLEFVYRAEPLPNPQHRRIVAAIKANGGGSICSVSAGSLIALISERVGERLVGFLMFSPRSGLNAGAWAEIYSTLRDGWFNRLLLQIRDSVGSAVALALDATGLQRALERFAAEHCQFLAQELRIPTVRVTDRIDIDSGFLVPETDGSATYHCPPPGPVFQQQPQLVGRLAICDEPEKSIPLTIPCNTLAVVIEFGDNGAALDDIFEMRVAGIRQSSNFPSRLVSRSVRLPVGESVVELEGFAAPDGIGTYFIRFQGARVLRGDALSGTDLVPGTIKRFVIEAR